MPWTRREKIWMWPQTEQPSLRGLEVDAEILSADAD